MGKKGADDGKQLQKMCKTQTLSFVMANELKAG
jgi:hypothetical protein